MLAVYGSTITAAFQFLPEPLQREDLGVRRLAAFFLAVKPQRVENEYV